ncbi:hypothetical protein CspeluHIS016_0114170 [Cutaneotrichosporon spelunceum]|uniref:Uncharacterized protein n=1 Tax=Cutaneotrichosporon spelunceum TaxID=1672016 RepID=A0AAD3Y9F3_9TREE|nr:hypothetical protein CspeluHIS016_0114170 [Cutaneotrichosporon spelunceum]
MDLATTPEHPNLHPLEVQRGTKLRLHMERIAPTSIAPIDITRAVDIAHEILAGLFETYDPAAYADAFARCRSVPLVVMCVRTFFEVERLLAERHAAEVAQAAARERAEEEEAERERAQAEARADAWARERAGMPEVVIHDDSPSCSSYLEPTGFLGRRVSGLWLR